MTYQRRRGSRITIYPFAMKRDARGNDVKVPDFDNPIVRRASWTPQRSSRAEVPGQVEVNVIRVQLPPDLPNVGLWAEVDFLGKRWDVAAPPSEYGGTRHVRHDSVDLRELPPRGRRSSE